MADVIAGLETDLEEAKSVMRSSSNAHASAAKALVRLRNNRENYIKLLEYARKSDSTDQASFRVGDESASDLLSPFLLLLSHKDVPSVGVCASLSGVQRLIQSQILTTTDGENVCHMLETLFSRRENSIDFKVMQTCSILGQSRKSVSIDVCKHIVSITCSIADEERTKDLAVRKAAIGCLIQISTAVIEKVTGPSPSPEDIECARKLFEELCSVPERNDSSSAARAGMGLLRGMALFGGGKSGASAPVATSQPPAVAGQGRPPSHSFSSASESTWIEPNKICNKDAIEIIDSLISDHPSAFTTLVTLSELVREKCGPMVLNLLKGKYRENTQSGGYGWPLMVRVMRATKTLLKLRTTCGVTLIQNLFNELVAVLEAEDSDVIVTPPWLYILTLEALLASCQSPGFLPYMFATSLPAVTRTVDALSRLIQTWSSPPQEWIEIDQIAKEAEINSRDDKATRKTRSRGLDLLTDHEPPRNFTGSMIVLVATECLVAALADCGLKDTPTIRVGGLLRRSNSTSPLKDETEEIDPAVRRAVLENTWKPCLAAFSCMLAGCMEEGMVQYILRAYMSLTTSCGAAKLVEARDSFISSMCRYALPESFTSHSAALTSFQSTENSGPRGSSLFGKDAPYSSGQGSTVSIVSERLLTHKHLQILKTLFNVAHGLGSILGTSWHIVLETFEQLDLVLHVQQAQLNLAQKRGVDSEGEDSQSMSQQLEELDEEEMDAETRMIESMLKNLFETSKYLDDDAVLNMIIALSQMIFTNLAHAQTSSPSTNGANSVINSPNRSSNQPTASAPRRLLENLSQSIKTALIQTTTIASPSLHQSSSQQQLSSLIDSDDFRFPPFALDKLVETAELNMERIGTIWEVVGSTLLTVASAENDSKIRAFAVKAMEKLVTKVVITQDNAALRRDVVRKFTELARSPQSDTKDFALHALYRFVSSAGHRLEGLWNLIVAELLIIATTMQSNKQTSTNAFKLVQLVMDDYRPSLDMGCLPSLALCLRAFGEQQNDVNMALTSVHHLWLLCEKGDESLEFSQDNPSEPTKESLFKANALWLHVFDQLRGLSLDPRMEVRNSALRSLCTNVVACGDRLTVSSWRTCALDIMLPLVDAVDAKAFSANASEHVLGERLSTLTGARMTLHHSQDTEEKQWRETRVTAIQGTGKVVASIMHKVPHYDKLEWFPQVWERTLACVERALNSNSPARDVIVGSVSVLEELSLLVCGAKTRLKYAVPGMRVVNGALVKETGMEDSSSEAEPNTKKSKNIPITTHLWLWGSILQVFERIASRNPPPFDAEVAALLVNIYAELLDTKECQVIRQYDSLVIMLQSCALWAKHFCKMKNSSKFISPLERNILKAYSRIAPVESDEIWVKVIFAELQKLVDDDTMILSGKTAPASPDEDDFKNKVKLVYAELFAQAPNSVKAGFLKEALDTNTAMSSQMINLGLSALPDSGFLDEVREDVWMQVIQKSDEDKTSMKVLMEEGVSLLRNGKVPLAVKETLLKRMERETISSEASFATKVEMLNTLMNAVSVNAESPLAVDLLPSFLVCASDALTHYDEPKFGAFLQQLVDLEIAPETVTQTTRAISELAQNTAMKRRYRKPHLIHLINQIEHVAAYASDANTRAIAAKALGTIARDGWMTA